MLCVGGKDNDNANVHLLQTHIRYIFREHSVFGNWASTDQELLNTGRAKKKG